MLLCTVTEMNGFDVVRGGTGGGVFLYATRHDEPAVMEVGRMENAKDRLGGERERYSKRERKSRSVTTFKRSLQAEAGGRNAETAYSQQLTLGNPNQSIRGSGRQSQS